MASTANVRNLDNSILLIKGVFKSEVRMFGRSHRDVIHVVPDGYSCVIGMNFLTPLKVTIDCVELCTVDRGEFHRERPDEQIHAVRTEFVDWTKEATWKRKAKKVAALNEQRNPALRSLFKKVIIRLPLVRKGMPPYSKPMTSIEVLGYYTYFLHDGQKHNA